MRATMPKGRPIRHDRLVVANNMCMEGSVAHTLQTVQMLDAFAGNDVDVHYLWPHFDRMMPQLPQLPISLHPLSCLQRAFQRRQIEFALRMMVWNRRHGFGDTPLFTRNIGVAFAAQFVFPRVAFEIHDDVAPMMKMVLRRLGERVSLVPISAGLAERLTAELGVPRERMLVAHDGVDFEKFDAAEPLPSDRRPLPPAKCDHVHLYIGTLKPERGLSVIAAAAKRLPDHGFVLIGGTDEDVRQARQMGLDGKNVLVMPAVPHDQVPALLKSYDTLLAPYTRQDPLYRSRSPLKLFEYMASGTACVVSKIGSITEVATDDVVWTFDPDVEGSFVAALRNVAGQRAEAMAKAERGRRMVAEHYTWRQRAQAIHNFLTA